jgi:signal transduction histidine kinase/ligand-binding sensor domain-containing protein
MLSPMELARRVASVLSCLWVALWPADAPALDPHLDISQYGHTAWRNLDGFGPGTIQPIAQTTDGYLWLGGPLGLMRFDGVTAVRWEPPPGTVLPDQRVRALLGTRDGTLWIGTLRGVASWKDGTLTTHAPLRDRYINAFLEDADGTVWVAGAVADKGFLCAIRQNGTECQGDDGRFGRVVMALYRDAQGALWVAGTDRVWRWKPDPAIAYVLPDPIGTLGTITAAPGGGILVGTIKGTVAIADGGVRPFPIPGAVKAFNKLITDRDGALWISVVEGGLLHLHEGRVEAFTPADGLSGDQVYGMFEDSEGNMWVSTRDGLDRFRPIAAPFYGRAQGLNGRVLAVLAAKDGSLWVSTSVALYRVLRGATTQMRSGFGAILFEDRRGRIWTGTRAVLGHEAELGYIEGERFVAVQSSESPSENNDAIAEDSNGNLWVAQPGGLLRIGADGTRKRQPWKELGDMGWASSLASDPATGGLWIGTWSGALVHVLAGKVRKLIAADPETSIYSPVNHIRVDGDGTLWVSTERGLIRLRDGHEVRLDARSGLPCDSVYASLEDERSLWIYTGCGIVQAARADVASWASAAERGAVGRIPVRLLDHWDGIRTDILMTGVGQTPQHRPYSPRMARTPDGRIWAIGADGVSVIDPQRLPFNAIPPPVVIERIVGDGTQYDARGIVKLPALLKNLEVQYNGVSLTLPQKVRFRYKLDGRDAAWQEVGNRRRAFYTDLPPGDYRFRVMAANDSGVWNEQGAALHFSIAAAWWQTAAFRFACAAALALLLYGAYRMRMATVARHYEVALDARVNERLRIGRDLHDTLLQSFHGLLLRFQAALQLWPRAEGRQMLEKAIDQAADAITEGRDAVQGLRASASESNDLAEALRTLGETLATDYDAEGSMQMSVEVEGTPRPLRPIVRDEIFRIAGEALRNAFRHANARRIEVQMRYDDRNLRVRVRDNGKGIEAGASAANGRHFGMQGMRERATLIGGKLAVWSAKASGTEVELTIPASRAYAPLGSNDDAAGWTKVAL